MPADVGCRREDQSGSRTLALNAKTHPAAATRAMPDVVYRDFTIRDLTTRMEDGRYLGRAAVVRRSAGRVLSQRFFDFETFDTEAQASARAQAGARAWIDEERWDVPLALPTNYADRFISEQRASAATVGANSRHSE